MMMMVNCSGVGISVGHQKTTQRRRSSGGLVRVSDLGVPVNIRFSCLGSGSGVGATADDSGGADSGGIGIGVIIALGYGLMFGFSSVRCGQSQPTVKPGQLSGHRVKHET